VARGKNRTSSKRTQRLYAGLLAVAALAAAALWWAGRGEGRSSGSPERAARQEYAPYTGPLEFPEEVREASGDLPQLYEFVARRPDVFHYMPCFCGCWRDGHGSIYDCFVDEVESDGRVDIDDMGFTCDICQDVARVAMQMLAEGKSLSEIQRAVDRKYAAVQDQRTRTPLPPLSSAATEPSSL
jgi:hypothetical protein